MRNPFAPRSPAGFRLRPSPRSPWSYRPGTSPLHRARPAAKLAGLFAVTASALAFPPWGALAGGALVVSASLAARMRPPELLRGFRPALLMILAVTALRGVKFGPLRFDPGGFASALGFGAAVAVSFAGASLFFAVTPMTDLRRSLEPLLGRRASLTLSLTLGFLPRFFAVWEESSDAWAARGGRGGFRALVTLLPLVLARMIVLAGETAEALESRGALLPP